MENTEIYRIFRLTRRDPKPLYGILAHLTSEVGELAEAVEIHSGHSNKKPSEPLIGEVADVIQCALSVLARAYSDTEHDRLLQDLQNHMRLKNNKWEEKQDVLIQQLSTKDQEETSMEVQLTPIEQRTIKIICEQLGLSEKHVKLSDRIIEDCNSDSLDIVELVMALEDEFGIEISSAQEQYIERHVKTVRDVLDFVNKVTGK